MSKKMMQTVNPYLPPWEHIPDGEPRVFNDRVYIYGSHDSQRNSTYCGHEYVVWSAPVDDLSNWVYHGESFNCGGLLYAPDVVEKEGKYYLYTYDLSHGNHVAVSDRPEGPFSEVASTSIGADPAVLVDDDGRVYAYWGYQNCYAAELDPSDMATILSGTQITDLIPSCNDLSEDNIFKYYEGASIRKIGDKYCLVYCQKPAKGSDAGVIHDNYRARLVYALSDKPLGPYTYGGIIIDNGGELLENGTLSYYDGNNHGGIIKIKNQWYIFYHRMTNNSEFSRQAMVEPIEVNEQTGEIKQAEMTSQGFNGGPLNAYEKYSAAIVCYLTDGAYITTAYTDNKDLNPITNITDGVVAGIKYIDFETYRQEDKLLQLHIEIMPKGIKGSIDVRLDHPIIGDLIGSIDIPDHLPREYYMAQTQVENVRGNNHKLFFVFNSKEAKKQICEINTFEFRYTDSKLTKGLGLIPN